MKLRKGVVLTHTEEGTFLLDTRAGAYWHLNPAGFDVLEALVRGEALEVIVDRIAAAQDVDRATVAEDCAGLLHDLRAAHLVKGSR